MKLLLQYLVQRKNILIIEVLFLVIFVVSFKLYHLPLEAVIYPAILCAIIGIIVMIYDFIKIKDKHNNLQKISSITDTVTTPLPKTCDIENKDYQEIISKISEEFNMYRTKSKRQYADMIDYYTVWVHQIKTPIASMRLQLQNEDTPFVRTISSDLHRIEQYVEMVLTFLRLNLDSTDYVIKEYDLDYLVRGAVKKFSTDFIARKIRLVYKPLNTTVITDEKWFSFVIEQVLSNALKYTQVGSITISLINEKTLRISDTGIGIAIEDLPRIFENGYTGYNGRTYKKASGIGLYLCKRICNNLGHTISASSTINVGTNIDIDLSQVKLEIE